MRLLKTIATSVIVSLFILSINSLWYAVLMRGFYENSRGAWVQVSRDNPSVPLIYLSILSLSLLMTVLFPTFDFNQKRPLVSNVTFGVLMGLLYVLPTSLYYLGTTNILAPEVMGMDVAWHMIEEGSAGVMLGAIFRSRLWQ